LPYEQASLLQLIKTDNKVLNKIVTVFAALNCEIVFLINEGERKYFYGLLMYGEGPEASKDAGDNLTQMGRYISFLQEMSCFTKRCYEVVKTSLLQLNVLYSLQKASFKIETTDMHLKQSFLGIGNLLRVLITLDSIIEQHPKIKDDWNAYKRMIKNIHHNPVKFQVDVNKFYRYEKHLVELEGKLLDGYIFQNCVEQIFDNKEFMVSKNTALSVEFLLCIRLSIEELEPQLNENSCLELRNRFVAICALSVLYNQIYRIFDKKVFKQIWDTYKKVSFHL
jgi:WASH complex subunit 7